MGKREIAVGVLFFASMGAFLALALVLAADTFEFGKETRPIEIGFDDVSGLAIGSPVRLNGQEIGNVEAIRRDPDTNSIVVTGIIDANVRLRQNYNVEIRQTLFGTTFIAVYDDPSSRLPLVDLTKPLDGNSLPDPFAEISKASASANDLLATLQSTVEEVQQLLQDARNPEVGLVGRLLADPSFADQVEALVVGADTTVSELDQLIKSLSEVVQAATSGNGLVSLILTNENFANEIREIVRNGESMAVRANNTMADIEAMVAGVKDGNGPLSVLISDNEARDNFRSIISDFSDAMPDVVSIARNLEETTTDINRGEGTLGRIVKDEALYVQLLQTLQTASRSLEDLRETTPVTTFASLLFQAFQ